MKYLVVDGPGIRTESELNQRGSWRKHSPRASIHRAAVCALVRVRGGARLPLPLVAILTRRAPSAGLDGDNLQGAMKHVRDGVADALGLPSDRDPRVAWHYHQERSAAGEWGIRVELAHVDPTPANDAPAPSTVLDLGTLDHGVVLAVSAHLRELADQLLLLRPCDDVRANVAGRFEVRLSRRSET